MDKIESLSSLKKFELSFHTNHRREVVNIIILLIINYYIFKEFENLSVPPSVKKIITRGERGRRVASNFSNFQTFIPKIQFLNTNKWLSAPKSLKSSGKLFQTIGIICKSFMSC